MHLNMPTAKVRIYTANKTMSDADSQAHTI